MTVAVEAIQATSVIDKATMRAVPTAAAVDHFNALMAQAPHEVVHVPDGSGQSGNAITHFMSAQEAMMRQTYDDVRAFSVQAPGMDAQTMAARHIELSYQLAMVQMQFNSGVYVAQSSKNGLQTLMKNQ
jgi:type III secretion system HrpB2-like protein